MVKAMSERPLLGSPLAALQLHVERNHRPADGHTYSGVLGAQHPTHTKTKKHISGPVPDEPVVHRKRVNVSVSIGA